MVAAKSLWGDMPKDQDLPDIPSKILKEQGEILTEATSGILIGEIKGNVIAIAAADDGIWLQKTATDTSGSELFVVSLRIKVPALNGYIFEVLSIEHSIELYPVTIRDYLNVTSTTCRNVDEYEQALTKVLSSKKVKSAVATLLAQASVESAA